MKIAKGLVVETLPDGGCLIVDASGRQSHALRPQAAAVLQQIEQGVTEVAAIATASGLDGGLVESAVAELVEAGVVEIDGSVNTRREWLARAATVAGAAAGLKLIETIATPSPAAAQSLVDDTQTDGDAGG